MEYDYSLKLANNSRIWCDTLAYLGFATYSLDTSPLSNPHYLVTMREISVAKPDTTPLGRPIKTRRSVEISCLLKWFTAVLDIDGKQSASWDDISMSKTIFWLFHLHSISQVMSIINFKWTDPANVTAGFEGAFHHVFHSWSTRHVWAYDFSSRTAKLGAVVAYLGAFCVLLVRIPLSIFGGLHRFSVIELLASALEYVSRGEFLNYHGITH